MENEENSQSPTADNQLYDKTIEQLSDLKAEQLKSLMGSHIICPDCGYTAHGLLLYYNHRQTHDSDGPFPLKLRSKKRAARAPLASELREAMEAVGGGVMPAARHLGVSRAFFVKWALKLMPEEFANYKKLPWKNAGSGKHARDITKYRDYKRAEKILAGTLPSPRRWQLYPHQRMAFLQRWGLLPDTCMMCGFNEHRVTDFKVPLLLNFIDFDNSNWKLDNLQILCYNCYFLNVHDMWGRSKRNALS